MDFILNISILVLYLIFYVYVYKKYPIVIIAFFYLFYGYLSMVVSVFYLDIGNQWAFEVARNSMRSNSLVVLFFFYISIFVGAIIGYKLLVAKTIVNHFASNINKSKIFLTPKFIFAFMVFSILYMMIMYIHLFYSGIPILLGYNKGEFWSYAKFPIFQVLHNQTSTILLILGFFYAYIKIYRDDNSKFTIFIFPLKGILWFYVMYIVLMAYKFGGPVLYLFSFYCSFLILSSIKEKFKLKSFFKYLFFFIILLIPLLYYVYFTILGFGNNAWQVIFDRVFALQGQVWHFIYNDISHGKIRPDISQLGRELSNAISHNYPKDTGINHLMQLIMPQPRLDSYLNKGVRMSGGYPANLFAIFNNNYIIVLVHFILSSVVVFFHLKFIKHLIKLNLFKFVVWFKIAFLSKGFLFMGDLNSILSTKTIFLLLIIILILHFEEQIISKKVSSEFLLKMES